VKPLRLSLLALASVALAGCGNPFDPANLVESVRLLAVSADKPYAAPGDTVKMTALAFDGRPPVTPPLAPMTVYWVPIVCTDPPGDAYFACYPAFAQAGLKQGVDLTSKLTAGTQFSFQMSPDAITRHARPASGAPYGVVFVFAIACAGHVQYLGVNEDTLPPAPPLGCFDDTGAELGADGSVFAYAQVFSFEDRKNQNPVISNLTFNGTPVDPTAGITVAHCPSSSRKCPTTPLDTVVPSSSWEPDPAETATLGKPTDEEIWVDYFLTTGSVDSSALLYAADPTVKLPSSAVKLTPPTSVPTTPQFLWAVVHDNRGGVSWLQVPLNVQ
jgi:hypothetical protein